MDTRAHAPGAPLHRKVRRESHRTLLRSAPGFGGSGIGQAGASTLAGMALRCLDCSDQRTRGGGQRDTPGGARLWGSDAQLVAVSVLGSRAARGRARRWAARRRRVREAVLEACARRGCARASDGAQALGARCGNERCVCHTQQCVQRENGRGQAARTGARSDHVVRCAALAAALVMPAGGRLIMQAPQTRRPASA